MLALDSLVVNFLVLACFLPLLRALAIGRRPIPRGTSCPGIIYAKYVSKKSRFGLPTCSAAVAIPLSSSSRCATTAATVFSFRKAKSTAVRLTGSFGNVRLSAVVANSVCLINSNSFRNAVGFSVVALLKTRIACNARATSCAQSTSLDSSRRLCLAISSAHKSASNASSSARSSTVTGGVAP